MVLFGYDQIVDGAFGVSDLSGDVDRLMIEPGSPPLTYADYIEGFWGAPACDQLQSLVAAGIVFRDGAQLNERLTVLRRNGEGVRRAGESTVPLVGRVSLRALSGHRWVATFGAGRNGAPDVRRAHGAAGLLIGDLDGVAGLDEIGEPRSSGLAGRFGFPLGGPGAGGMEHGLRIHRELELALRGLDRDRGAVLDALRCRRAALREQSPRIGGHGRAGRRIFVLLVSGL